MEMLSTKKPVKRSQSRLQPQDSSRREPSKSANACRGLEKKECTKEIVESSGQAPTVVGSEPGMVDQAHVLELMARAEDSMFSPAAAAENMTHGVAVGG